MVEFCDETAAYEGAAVLRGVSFSIAAGERIAWMYGPRHDFFSQTRGSCQRLPNGNTLFTESDKGRVFEVTREGQLVWEFHNPDVDENAIRGAIWRMTRFSEAELPFVRDQEAGG